MFSVLQEFSMHQLKFTGKMKILRLSIVYVVGLNLQQLYVVIHIHELAKTKSALLNFFQTCQFDLRT